jgi:hypothetical protein
VESSPAMASLTFRLMVELRQQATLFGDAH